MSPVSGLRIMFALGISIIGYRKHFFKLFIQINYNTQK